MTGAEITSVAYKKGNLLRYILWGLAVVAIVLLSMTFVSAVSGGVSGSVPDGYRFAVTDNYTEGSKVRTTYYVYEDQILVEDESFEKDKNNRVVLIYDGISTKDLKLDEEDTTQICQLGSCREQPKVLAVIKKIISRKIPREYIGL